MKEFYSSSDFNQAGITGNCLKFALMQKGEADDGQKEWELKRNDIDPDTGRPFSGSDGTPVESFLRFSEKRGLKMSLVSSIEETEGKVSFFLWGWYKAPTALGYIHNDFHVVRRNSDGSFEHKPDNKSSTAIATTLEEVSVEYNEPPFIFILEE